MKIKLAHPLTLAALAATLTAFAPAAFAQLTIPYADGSDGALNISNNTVIDLSQAVTGVWTNSSASPGNGIYDPAQWAVVFKYSSINIAPGATLTFSNHPSRAPVVWLVSGNVMINGTLSLDGQSGGYGSANLTEPGPGGFRGSGGTYNSPGFGPGGGVFDGYWGYGSYLNYSYGNTNIIPLVGGSGGANNGLAGGAGGGALLVAASGSLTVNGVCHANGGGSYYNRVNGSGGAIRLVATQILGNGTIQATGTDNGRIRLEANLVTNTLTIWPLTLGVAPANPPVIFPPANAPTVKILSIGGTPAPPDPKAAMPSGATANGDVTIATVNTALIQLKTMNFPTNGTVNVYIKPLQGQGSQTILPAAFVSGDSNQAVWQASANLPTYAPLASQPGYAVIQARAFVP